MGYISRKIFPACGNLCVCCPALRSRSRQPVKRYKKLLAGIFPKSPDGPPNERNIVKLCEYAAKNPFRIPKVAKYLEERCYKELRCDHVKLVNIVSEVYNKLLCICKEQVSCFAASLLNVINELLDSSKRDVIQITGCQTLTRFIYSQVDKKYSYDIANLVRKVCKIARGNEEHQNNRLTASSLQCLSAMVWFMAEFSLIFDGFDEVGLIVHVTLDHYESDAHVAEDDERGEAHHNWVEVVRCEGRGGAYVGSEISGSSMIIGQRPEKKDPSLLTREEVENPKVWAQICIQRMVELSKENPTMRPVLDPMFAYFDTKCHWVSRNGLAMTVLSDMTYFLESSGSQQLMLTTIVRHLDHKNVSHDPEIKTHIIQTACALARQIRSRVVLSDIGFVSDLCKLLRKSLQATVSSAGEQVLNSNITLQNAVEDCLLESARGIADARPLFDMMARTLEFLPSEKVGAKATIGSLIILAHMISVASVSSHSQQVFPEALLVQLLKVMLHPDVEVRVGAHQIFSALLVPSSNHPRHNASDHTRRWHSNNACTFASISALLEKLRSEKDGTKVEKLGNYIQDDLRERDNTEEEWKQGWTHKHSPNFLKISSFIDKTAGSTNLAEAEPSIMKFSEDQISQLLSAFWRQANLPDNLPSNIEAIAHSFCLTLISSRLRNPNESLVIRFFQLPLSLRKMSLGPTDGSLPAAYQRSLLVLATAMLMFASKMYQIPDLSGLLKSLLECDVDPYLAISDDLQVYVKPQADVREYGSVSDNQAATSLLIELQKKTYESDKILLDLLVQNLSSITKSEADDLVKQLSEAFTPDPVDALVFGPQSMLDLDIQADARSNESLSFDTDYPINSFVEDDVTSEPSVADFSNFIPRMPPSPSMSHMMSIGSTLSLSLSLSLSLPSLSLARSLALPLPPFKIISGGVDQWLAIKLPPASPFDNFLRAAHKGDGEKLGK
ncbi:hypothetical protein RJ639_034282 [Escallonia herrerae]|uniref:ARM repeat superfamily protein n=1 Tax=Escallonia herrerae TaxID=1293975 RepID=A0AA88WUU8_9ASTE|nr:hypothetical protein RJ639_034282 [Escallonia herrerae]